MASGKEHSSADRASVHSNDYVGSSIDDSQDEEEDTEIETLFNVQTWKEDLTLIVEGKQLYVASGLLIYVSPVFSSKLEKAFKTEGPRHLELPGRFDDFIEFLRCIYPGVQKQVSISNALSVVPFAHEYQVEIVKEAGEIVLQSMVCDAASLESLCSILTCADSCRLESLRQAVLLELTRREQAPHIDLETALPLSPRIRQMVDQFKVIALKRDVDTLTEKVSSLEACLEDKSRRCIEFENFVKGFWAVEMGVVHLKGLELRMISLDVSDDRRIGEKIKTSTTARNITWTMSAEFQEDYHKSRQLVVILSACGDPAWKQWKCTVKANCSATGGDEREQQQSISQPVTSDSSALYFTFRPSAITSENCITVAVIFAVGDVVI